MARVESPRRKISKMALISASSRFQFSVEKSPEGDVGNLFIGQMLDDRLDGLFDGGFVAFDRIETFCLAQRRLPSMMITT